jgi:hypothetical protein
LIPGQAILDESIGKLCIEIIWRYSAMNLGNIDFYLIFDLFILLLIGMGPKIALVPFLDLTKEMDGDTQKKVARRMVQTAVVTALILVH